MRVCLIAGLLVLAFGADAESKTINNVTSLTDNDWSTWYEWEESDPGNQGKAFLGDTFRTLSLRPSEKWDSGVAWFISIRHVATYERTTKVSDEFHGRAYKGFYAIRLHPTDEDVVVIRVGFTKKYVCTERFNPGKMRFSWELERSFRPEGADLLLTLENGDTVPRDSIEVSVDRGYYVDASGGETTLHYEPDTLMERLAGKGQVRKLRYLDFQKLGATIRFKRGDSMRGVLGSDTPPTYWHRGDQVDVSIEDFKY